jgi:hypothetical protein
VGPMTLAPGETRLISAFAELPRADFRRYRLAMMVDAEGAVREMSELNTYTVDFQMCWCVPLFSLPTPPVCYRLAMMVDAEGAVREMSELNTYTVDFQMCWCVPLFNLPTPPVCYRLAMMVDAEGAVREMSELNTYTVDFQMCWCVAGSGIAVRFTCRDESTRNLLRSRRSSFYCSFRQRPVHEPTGPGPRRVWGESPQARVWLLTREESPQSRVWLPTREESPQARVWLLTREESPQSRVWLLTREESPRAKAPARARTAVTRTSLLHFVGRLVAFAHPGRPHIAV